MKKLTSIIVLILIISNSYSQKIELKSSFWNYELKQNDKPIISLAELEKIVENNAESLKYIQNARANKTMVDIFSFIGGLGIGYSIGTSFGKNPNYIPGAIGLGFVGLSIPFITGTVKNLKKGTDSYNTNYQKTTSYNSNQTQELGILASSNGIGILVKF